MTFPKSEVRKVQNGFIVTQSGKEWIFDNFLEMAIALAEQYDEVACVQILDHWRKESEATEELMNEVNLVPLIENLNSV